MFQENIFSSERRHICGSGGYGNGKTTAFTMRSLLFLGTFPGYRMVIARLKSTDLNKTTRVTFFNICPPMLYNEGKGGKRADSLNYLRLINGSEVHWMHLDDFDEGTVRGLEVNSVFIDQAEEIGESIYLHLDNRVGRWPQALVPDELLALKPNWPLHPANNKPRVPGWMGIGCNPDVFSHWIYKRYHKDSLDWQTKYKKRYVMFEAETDQSMLDPETYAEALSRDPAWLERFFKGKWGIGEGTIHRVSDESKLYVGDKPGYNDGKYYITHEFLENLKRKAALYRIMDHGESAPTCVGWVAAYKGMHIFYREYYQGDTLVSEHRQNVTDLSEKEQYMGNYADPSIFHKTSQKNGGRWSVSDEYVDRTASNAPTLFWQPADNNEFSNRNRINELLRKYTDTKHPVTGNFGAPRLYFIMRNDTYPTGCYHIPLQTSSQKRIVVGTDNGKPLFSDERDDNVVDHGYDVVRYYVSLHTLGAKDPRPKLPENSFEAIRKQLVLANRSQEAIYSGFYAQ